MGEAVLELRHVTKRYDERVVLDDVSFEIPRGAIVALMGRSGSGKSTLFKLIAGLDRPTSGEVRVDGEDLAAMDDRAISALRLRKIGMVFQSHNLLPDVTVEHNVRLPLDLAGVPKADAIARARELLAVVGIEDLAASRPHRLSGGESQRAAIARALANDPAIVLADEPTASLDVANAENVIALFQEVNARLGTAILLVTHDREIADKVPACLRMNEGRAVWERPLPRAQLPRPG